MNWYYTANGEQKGPIDPAELDRLVAAGFITPATLVWREGMPAWQSYGDLGDTVAPAAGQAQSQTVICSECQRPFGLDQIIRLGSGYVCGNCKAVALQKLSEGISEPEFERIRRQHLKHEASVKSVGSLYLLAAIISVLGGAANLIDGETTLGTIIIILGGAMGWLGSAVNKLRSWVRIPLGILSGIGLLGIPVGTIINAYILYLVFSKKGATVFSDDYKRVIAATPHIKYKTSIVIWIALVLLLALFALGIFAVLFGSRR